MKGMVARLLPLAFAYVVTKPKVLHQNIEFSNN
jgi:hypothetical protein